MANHKSSKKRIRQTLTKRAHNRLFHKTARNAVKALRTTTEKSAAEALLPKVTAMLDKLAKHNIVHKNKAATLTSSIPRHVTALQLFVRGRSAPAPRQKSRTGNGRLFPYPARRGDKRRPADSDFTQIVPAGDSSGRDDFHFGNASRPLRACPAISGLRSPRRCGRKPPPSSPYR